jgi:hypothetical protein
VIHGLGRVVVVVSEFLLVPDAKPLLHAIIRNVLLRVTPDIIRVKAHRLLWMLVPVGT